MAKIELFLISRNIAVGGQKIAQKPALRLYLTVGCDKYYVMRILIYVICLTTFMCSCIDNECGDDISLGKLDLAETSLQFIPYSGDEILTFEDNFRE